jgi:hypothetical protein
MSLGVEKASLSVPLITTDAVANDFLVADVPPECLTLKTSLFSNKLLPANFKATSASYLPPPITNKDSEVVAPVV